MRRKPTGIAFVLVILFVVFLALVEIDTMSLRYDGQTTVVILLLTFMATLLGFMFITDWGFSKYPRPSRYYL